MNLKFTKKILLKSLLFVGLLGQACGPSKGTETGDPGVEIYLSSYSQSGSSALLDFFLPKAFAAVSSVSMCFHQIRFKKDQSSSDPGQNVNIAADFSQWSPEGTSLGVFSVPPGAYQRVDLFLKDECDEESSLMINNDSGTFVTTSPITIRFRGSFTISEDSQSLGLVVGPLVDFFDGVTSNNQLKPGVESIEGGIE